MPSLADFLKEQAQQLLAQAPERDRVRQEWVEAVERLIRQIEMWLVQADTDKVLRVERTAIERREHRVGTYVAPALVISLGERRVTITPVARYALGPTDLDLSGGRSRGLVEISDGAYKYRLFCYDGPDGDRWILLDEDEYVPTAFDRSAFDAVMVKLLQ